MMFSWILILAICIWAFWYWGERQTVFPDTGPENSPTEILKSRFAKGEITEEEYEERRAVLDEKI